jgi:hypothetical protein
MILSRRPEEKDGCNRGPRPELVELYPACEAHSAVSVLGERSTVEEIEFSDLLSILLSIPDRAKRSPHPG